ncbi:STAS domain-containing protein [Dyella japonica]|uniref:STAS domain-containing protein n=1 Tax=Dyella japonica TaxID=231455 RepID=UPI0009DA66C1|nr:STAS domain-containing protein [Dyella japonica]
MTIDLDTENCSPRYAAIHLRGRLDSLTFSEFDEAVVTVLQAMPMGGTVVLDLSGLEYISSAGLRSIAKLRRSMRARNGQILFANPQAQVRRVFEIIKAAPINDVFSSLAELDHYLDHIQGKIVHGDDDDNSS